MHTHYGIIFIGGGLSSILAAYAWLQRGYNKPILIIEQSEQICGNHTWSFNRTDILSEAWHTLTPLIDISWQGYEVQFPKITKKVNIPYHSIASESLMRKIRKFASQNPLLNIITAQKATITQRGNLQLNPVVKTQDEQEYTAEWVVQATGASQSYSDTAYQKFLGLEIQLDTPANIDYPLIMDATLPQKDGFRFMYVLPFEPNRLLIEDTYYSLNSNLDTPHLTKEIHTYAKQKGWNIAHIVRQEQGVLPIPLQQYQPRPIEDRVLPLGMHANLFHPTTGYALAANYNFIWQMYSHLNEKNLHIYWYRQLYKFYKSMQFYRVMNRFLFIAGKTNKRYRFLEIFYQRQSDEIIGRFYAGKNTLRDKLSIFSGKAPFLPSWYMLASIAGKREEIKS